MKVKSIENNQYQKRPKDSRYQLYDKIEKENSIKKAISQADEELMKFRQQFLNNRKNKGMDRLFQEVMSDWHDLAKLRKSDE